MVELLLVTSAGWFPLMAMFRVVAMTFFGRLLRAPVPGHEGLELFELLIVMSREVCIARTTGRGFWGWTGGGLSCALFWLPWWRRDCSPCLGGAWAELFLRRAAGLRLLLRRRPSLAGRPCLRYRGAAGSSSRRTLRSSVSVGCCRNCSRSVFELEVTLFVINFLVCSRSSGKAVRSMSVVRSGCIMLAVRSATICDSSASMRNRLSRRDKRSDDCLRISVQNDSCPADGRRKCGILRAPIAQIGVAS